VVVARLYPPSFLQTKWIVLVALRELTTLAGSAGTTLAGLVACPTVRKTECFKGTLPPLSGEASSERDIAMRTVVIAHRDPAIAAALEADLREAGYHLNTCPGPFPPKLRCIQYDTGYCPLTDAADVLLYDPTLVALDDNGVSHNLAVESALSHPDIPMLVTGFTETEAEGAADVIAKAQNVVLAAQDRAEMLVQVNRLASHTLEMLARG
jgi:hypothetical protein